MRNILDNAFGICLKEYEPESNDKIIQNMILTEKMLKKRLNKKDKKLLLRIIDAKDLIAEDESFYTFINGFKLGLKIGYETNRK